MKSILCRNHSTILSNCSFRPTKICYFISFILHLMRSFSCRSHSMLFSNCSFVYNKDLLLYYIYFTAYEVYFMQKPFHYIIKLFFPLLQRFATLFHLFYILWGLFLVEPILWYYHIVLSSTTKITSLFRIFHISCGLFLAELSLFYYQIVLSSATKIYLYDAFILLLIRTISCRTSSILLSNCYFRYYKDLPLWCIYFTSY